jgi:hypothetical protein
MELSAYIGDFIVRKSKTIETFTREGGEAVDGRSASEGSPGIVTMARMSHPLNDIDCKPC